MYYTILIAITVSNQTLKFTSDWSATFFGQQDVSKQLLQDIISQYCQTTVVVNDIFIEKTQNIEIDSSESSDATHEPIDTNNNSWINSEDQLISVLLSFLNKSESPIQCNDPNADKQTNITMKTQRRLKETDAVSERLEQIKAKMNQIKDKNSEEYIALANEAADLENSVLRQLEQSNSQHPKVQSDDDSSSNDHTIEAEVEAEEKYEKMDDIPWDDGTLRRFRRRLEQMASGLYQNLAASLASDKNKQQAVSQETQEQTLERLEKEHDFLKPFDDLREEDGEPPIMVSAMDQRNIHQLFPELKPITPQFKANYERREIYRRLAEVDDLDSKYHATGYLIAFIVVVVILNAVYVAQKQCFKYWKKTADNSLKNQNEFESTFEVEDNENETVNNNDPKVAVETNT